METLDHVSAIDPIYARSPTRPPAPSSPKTCDTTPNQPSTSAEERHSRFEAASDTAPPKIRLPPQHPSDILARQSRKNPCRSLWTITLLLYLLPITPARSTYQKRRAELDAAIHWLRAAWETESQICDGRSDRSACRNGRFMRTHGR